ncbi:TetR/AcrR family transcriptional regulator [Streptomyces hainanensis]|uniref:TetR/AcrR family transcriptional regulator n=1 Tax=Streptomyces hainanensis TaxID=402648 RepID=A0A4R4TGE1_9ACTN|nr:TetR/AcrR family transcriptional regulator [Streptomyces hainanensis]TDC76550.1 TetR/AcrR family transcriptional regulator [Streptomyces hainanensis]
MTVKTARGERANATRELILAAAERLFAEQGVYAVSNRRVGEAAGQGNNTAVGYHFGTKTDLVLAIARRHQAEIERIRARALADAGDSADLAVWVACLVRPVTGHLAALPGPTWYARFRAQVATDPALHRIVTEEALASPTLRRIVDGLDRCLPELPPEVRAERGAMVRRLILFTCAEHERALADDPPTPGASWDEVATGLVDALVGLWGAPVTRRA